MCPLHDKSWVTAIVFKNGQWVEKSNEVQKRIKLNGLNAAEATGLALGPGASHYPRGLLGLVARRALRHLHGRWAGMGLKSCQDPLVFPNEQEEAPLHTHGGWKRAVPPHKGARTRCEHFNASLFGPHARRNYKRYIVQQVLPQETRPSRARGRRRLPPRGGHDTTRVPGSFPIGCPRRHGNKQLGSGCRHPASPIQRALEADPRSDWCLSLWGNEGRAVPPRVSLRSGGPASSLAAAVAPATEGRGAAQGDAGQALREAPPPAWRSPGSSWPRSRRRSRYRPPTCPWSCPRWP